MPDHARWVPTTATGPSTWLGGRVPARGRGTPPSPLAWPDGRGRRPRDEPAIDVPHNAVYAAVTGLIADALAHEQPAWQQARG